MLSLKGLAGNAIQLVTISDSDVLFLSNWQKETLKVFKEVSRKLEWLVLFLNFKTYESNCGNVLFDSLFNSKLQFLPVKNQRSLNSFL